MNAAEDAFHRALSAEQLQNARAVNALRLGALTVVLVLLAAFRSTLSGWIGPPLALVALWWTAAVVVFWASRYSERLARLGSFSIALIDMPMAFVVLGLTIERLHAAGKHGDAARLALHAGVYYVGLIVVASLAHEQRRIFLAAASAVVFETALMFLGRKEDLTIMVMTTAAMGGSPSRPHTPAVVPWHSCALWSNSIAAVSASAVTSRRRLRSVSSSRAISPPSVRGTR